MPSKVSVIIPTYNRAKVIGRAIESVLNQTYEYWELFIVDDGSTDNTKKVVSKKYLQDPRIFWVERPKTRKKGANACRNVGIEKSIGKYIALLDSDDEWHPEKIEVQLKTLMSQDCASDKLLCYTQNEIVKNGKAVIKPRRGLKDGERISDYLILNNGLIQTSSLFFPIELSQDLKFDENLPRHQDIDFLLRLELQNVEFIFVNKVLVKLFWDTNKNLYSTGWTPDFSEEFASDRRDMFSIKSYHNFLFIKVVLNCAKYGSKIKALQKTCRIKLHHVRMKYIAGLLKTLLS